MPGAKQMPARILIIEDNPESLELMVYLLNAFGHKPFKAIDGREGLEMMRRERPDLVLCDLQVPGIDGYGVARQVRIDPQLQNLPLVAVTASAMPSDRDKVLAAGFDGYISKPIAPEDFVSQIESFLERLIPRTHPPSGPGPDQS
jgi:CheY-like chemotaxis protein